MVLKGKKKGRVFQHGVIDTDGKMERRKIFLCQLTFFHFFYNHSATIREAKDNSRHPEQADLSFQTHQPEKWREKADDRIDPVKRFQDLQKNHNGHDYEKNLDGQEKGCRYPVFQHGQEGRGFPGGNIGQGKGCLFYLQKRGNYHDRQDSG